MSKVSINKYGTIDFKDNDGNLHRENWKPARIFSDGILECYIDNDCYYIHDCEGDWAMSWDTDTWREIYNPISHKNPLKH